MRLATMMMMSAGLVGTGCYDAGQQDGAAEERRLLETPCGSGDADGRPALSDAGCRAHVTIGGPVGELWDARGLRPQTDGFHYLAATGPDGAGDLRLLLPSVEPGTFGSAQCASLKLWSGTLTSSMVGGGWLEVEIAGRSEETVWGSLQAKLCTPGGDGPCVTREGLFAARLEPDNGPAVASEGCLEATECVPPLPRGAQGCGRQPICDDGVCTTQ